MPRFMVGTTLKVVDAHADPFIDPLADPSVNPYVKPIHFYSKSLSVSFLQYATPLSHDPSL